MRRCVCGEFLLPGQIPSPGVALEESVALWIEVGALLPLHQTLLSGYGHLLEGRASRLPKVANFLRKVPIYQGRLARIHSAAATGHLTTLARLLDCEAWTCSRDPKFGTTPLQKALMGRHTAAVKLILRKAPCSLEANDKMGRTALHYAAALDALTGEATGATHGKNNSWYELLRDAGADENAKDMLGRSPEYYQSRCSDLLHQWSNVISLHTPEVEDRESSGTVSESEPEVALSSSWDGDESSTSAALVFHVTVEIREAAEVEPVLDHDKVKLTTLEELPNVKLVKAERID